VRSEFALDEKEESPGKGKKTMDTRIRGCVAVVARGRVDMARDTGLAKDEIETDANDLLGIVGRREGGI
jgi:hypothetical protein